MDEVVTSRRTLLRVGAGLGLTAGAVLVAAPADAAVAGTPADVAHTWVAAGYEAVLLENLTPPTAARAYAHLAVAMYEAAVLGMPAHRGLGGQLTGLAAPAPVSRRGTLDWDVAVSTAARDCLLDLLPLRSPATAGLLLATHETVLRRRRAAGVPAATEARSAAHGRAVAERLRSWRRADGHAEASRLPYTPPSGEPWLWESTPPNYRPAVEPHCHLVRPMVLRTTDEVPPEPHVPFSDRPGSAFHAQALAVHAQSRANGDEERAIARFWTDNPGSFVPPTGTPTGLPGGHWMLIAGKATRDRGLRLDRVLETYVRLGVTLHDAFLACWTEKYRSNLLRPVTYLQRYVDPTWTSYVNTPQFPEHTSGHSVSSAAAALVLTRLLGTRPFVDDTAVVRGHAARSFSSFDDAALEAAGSRLFGGIHYPWAIETGLDQGRRLGDLVVARLRTRR